VKRESLKGISFETIPEELLFMFDDDSLFFLEDYVEKLEARGNVDATEKNDSGGDLCVPSRCSL